MNKDTVARQLISDMTLGELLRVLGKPGNISILAKIAEGSYSFESLEEFDIIEPYRLSKRLNGLQEDNIIMMNREGKYRLTMLGLSLHPTIVSLGFITEQYYEAQRTAA